MDYKHTIDILSENIKELALIVNGFAVNKRIPALELDLVLAKTRNLYDVLLMLKKYAVDEIKSSTEDLDTPLPVSKPVESIKTDKTKPGTDIDKEQIDFENENFLKPETNQNNTVDEKTENNAPEPKILSDHFKKQTSSLHENLIQSKSFYDLSAKLQSKPLTNISSAIGINERFLFIRELFQENTGKYNQTMQFLDNAHDFNEAYNYLTDNFQWDMNSEMVQKILELIRRKFITGKNE